MAKEVITRTWCDLCLDESEEDRPEAQATHASVLVHVSPGRPATLDLCDRHHESLLAPVIAAAAEFGAPINGAGTTRGAPRDAIRSNERWGKTPGPFPCRAPGCVSVLGNLSSFGSHVRQMHGLAIGQYRDTYGPIERDPDAAPVSAERGAIGPGGVTCPECGRGYSHAAGNTRPAQALGIHRWRAHGVKGGKAAQD